MVGEELASGLSKLLAALVAAFKDVAAFLVGRQVGKIEENNKTLERENEIKSKQLAIAARPKRGWRGLLDRMRSGDL